MSSKEEILFSVIIPTYNRCEYLLEALHNLQLQEYSNWEAIIIDDGSTDTTEQEVQKILLKDDRIQYFKQGHQERCAARNLGMVKAKGDYLIFHDDDDYLLPKHLSSVSQEIANETNHYEIIKVGAQFLLKNKELVHVPTYQTKSQVELKKNLFLDGCSPIFLVFHKKSIEKFRFQDYFLPFGEDFAFLFQCLDSGLSIKEINQYTAIQREHEERGVRCKRIEKIVQEISSREKILADILNHKNSAKWLTSSLLRLRKAQDYLIIANKAFRAGSIALGLKYNLKSLLQHCSMNIFKQFIKNLLVPFYLLFK